MGTFNTTKFISTELTDFSEIIENVGTRLAGEGYTFTKESGAIGDYFSITKGGIFKSVLGMKTALNVELTQMHGGISVSAKVGMFGQQVIPTMITLFVAWPVILTQIGGMVEQSKLDEKVIGILEEEIRRAERENMFSAENTEDISQNPEEGAVHGTFCTSCGAKLSAEARFCSSCGSPVQ